MIVYFDNGSNPFRKEFEDNGFSIFNPYAHSIKVKIVRVFEKLPMLVGFIYNQKLKNVSDDTIIVFDSNISAKFLQWLRKKNPNCRIILWYWNPVSTTIDPVSVPMGIEKWSYSPEDCRMYGLSYNTTFYFDSRVKKEDTQMKDNEHREKVLFVGRDKGRLDEILKWKHSLEKLGLLCNFKIVGNKSAGNYTYCNSMQYDEIVSLIKESDIIIDYYTDVTTGLSLRPMEALYYNKKLITNNVSIKDYDFYSDNNIYVVEDGMDDILSFITRPMDAWSKKIHEEYLMSSWIKRF